MLGIQIILGYLFVGSLKAFYCFSVLGGVLKTYKELRLEMEKERGHKVPWFFLRFVLGVMSAIIKWPLI